MRRSSLSHPGTRRPTSKLTVSATTIRERKPPPGNQECTPPAGARASNNDLWDERFLHLSQGFEQGLDVFHVVENRRRQAQETLGHSRMDVCSLQAPLNRCLVFDGKANEGRGT